MRFNNQGLLGTIQKKGLLVFDRHFTSTLEANERLSGFFVTVTSARKIIRVINKKDSLNLKRDLFFNSGQCASLILKRGKRD
jgi:hypothetical protein